MDELHAQTVALLSFQPLPKEVFDTQVTFNLSTGFGESARYDLADTAALIGRQLKRLLGSDAAERCAFQLVQAPLFHGMAASILVECERGVQTGGYAWSDAGAGTAYGGGRERFVSPQRGGY